MPDPTREAAFDLLSAVLDRRRPLEEALSALPQIAPRDRAAAHRLSAAVLRRMGTLDAVLEPFLRKEPPAQVRNVLRIGAAGLLLLSTPIHAAVATAVSLAQARGLKPFAGLVNAVLRRVATDGPAAMADLERSVTEILACFRPGRGNVLTDLFSRRIDRILVAATKADHLHHESHDRLQAIVRRLADRAIARANFTGAAVDVVAMAAVRATREGTVKQGKETLPVIIGTPLAGETIDGETFDGKTETAIFPGDLPEDFNAVFERSAHVGKQQNAEPPVRFVRFRPPKLERTAEGVTLSLPHIRLDRALQFLIGDRLA